MYVTNGDLHNSLLTNYKCQWWHIKFPPEFLDETIMKKIVPFTIIVLNIPPFYYNFIKQDHATCNTVLPVVQ